MLIRWATVVGQEFLLQLVVLVVNSLISAGGNPGKHDVTSCFPKLFLFLCVCVFLIFKLFNNHVGSAVQTDPI